MASAPLKIRIKKKTHSGKWFATVVDDVYVPDMWMKKHELDVDQEVVVQALPPANGNPSWHCISVPILPKEGVHFEDWQLNSKLPETRASDRFKHTHFACHGCGAVLLRPRDIYKIKGGGVWSRGMPPTVKPYGSGFFNKDKDTHLQDVCCVKCGAKSLGAFYAKPYKGCDDDCKGDEPKKQFPCVKLVYCRSPKMDPNFVAHHTVLSGSKELVLGELADFLAVPGAVYSETRLHHRTHEYAKQARDLGDNLRLLVGEGEAWKWGSGLVRQVEPKAVAVGQADVKLAPLNKGDHWAHIQTVQQQIDMMFHAGRQAGCVG